MGTQQATFCLKPAKAGDSVFDDETLAPLAQDGEDKPVNSYWLRRVRDGDVIICEETEKPAHSAAKKAGAK